MVVKIKEFLKRQDTSTIMTNLKSLYYEERETRDIMKKYYQMKQNFIISILFLIQYNNIHSRLISI